MYDGIARKSAPYLFLGQTTSLCETCLGLVPAKIVEQDGGIYYSKRCPEHGVMKTLVSDDPVYWRRTLEYLKPGDRPLGAAHPHRARLPVGLRPLPRPRAAFLPGHRRDQRGLQPRLSRLLRRFLAQAEHPPQPGRGRAHVRRPGGERRRARPGADLGRRAHHPSRDPRDHRRGAAPADQARDAEHQRHPHRRGSRLRRCAGRLQAGLRSLPAVRFA